MAFFTSVISFGGPGTRLPSPFAEPRHLGCTNRHVKTSDLFGNLTHEVQCIFTDSERRYLAWLLH